MRWNSMERLRAVAWALLICLLWLGPAPAHGQNPAWPPTDPDPSSLQNPAAWPDDPGYGYDIEGDGESCTGDDGRCWSNATGGQWNIWSWTPPQNLSREDFRPEEREQGAGTWTDAAWTVTTGDRRVVIAVLDSGINWDERDLVNQYYINTAELMAEGLPARCRPSPAGEGMDVDGDGFVTMRDWFAGRSAEERDALSAEIDEAGNRNGVAEPGDLITQCSDGVDDDGNGYIDDISGWDFHHDDNDPQDDTRYGHGTGEARWSAAEGNNGIGRIGYCPECRVLMVRVGDSFIVDAQDYAQSVVFSVDSGALVVQEALGSLNNTTYMRRAQDYAYERGVLVVASAADENSRHHNMPGTSNHTLYVHAIRYAGPNPQGAESFQVFNNCTNYGAQLVLSAPGTGCSSEATGVTAGIAGLVYAAAIDEDRPGGPLSPPLTAEEARQVILMSADDIHIPESQPDHPEYDERHYPSRSGWDQRFGYGRINAYRAVRAVREGRIPPQVDIVSPDWFRVFESGRDREVVISGSVDAPRASSFDYVVEWAPGIEPEDADWTTLGEESSRTEALDGELARLDISELVVNNPGEVENRYTVTIRVRAVARDASGEMVTQGEQRRAIAIVRDSSLLDGFPVALGVRNDHDPYPAASGESSPKMADVDGDGVVEIIYGDADGLLHAINGDGTEVSGYPVRLGTLRGLEAGESSSNLGSEAYASGAVPVEDVSSSILATPAVGDLDGDGALEIVIANMEGEIFVLNGADGTTREGWPVELPEVLSGDPLRMGPVSEDQAIEQGAFASPALADLDGDSRLEIIVAAFDGRVYVYNAEGSPADGFPVDVIAPILWTDPSGAGRGRIMTSPAVGDVNGDGLLDIAVGSNETGSDRNTGAVHVIHGNGNLNPGGAIHANWPISITSRELFPLVGKGVPSSIALADINADGVSDLAVAGTAAQMRVLAGAQPAREPGDDPEVLLNINSTSWGSLTDITDNFDLPLFNTFATASFGDLDADGVPDYITGGAGLNLAVNLAGGWENRPFSHQVGAWSMAQDGEALPGFPRRIEDYLFFMNPVVGDVSGDDYPEVVVGSGGYYLHAWDACGREADGWPKFVGSWMVGSPALGDIDGDGRLEAVAVTRMGYLFAFDTEGRADGAMSWPEFRHDGHNTGNFDAPLTIAGQRVAAESPISCPEPIRPDGGVMADGGTAPMPEDGGCGCRMAGGASENAIPWIALALIWLSRRKRLSKARRTK